jgi:EAL domain-containing protein (putative c-di-GMP-specific phosphodiesterase class I)
MLREDVDEVLDRLCRLGTLISVDDFGTGYGSLTYLRRFPISKIKVDQSFIKTMMSNQDDAEIVRAVVGLDRSLNMLVIAEGVETEDQLAFLKEINCDEVQGYYFSPPLPPDQIDELLSKGKFPLVT